MPKLIVFLVLFSQIAHAELRPEMQNLYKLVDKMQSYIFDKKEFLNQKNDKEIAENLRQFNETVTRIKEEKLANDDDMKFHMQQLREGLAEVEQAFRDNFKDYSYWQLKSTLNNCFSCHTQKSLAGTRYKMSAAKKVAPFIQADFLFLVRNYEESIPLFEKLIADYPSSLSTDELDTALQKILYYSVRVKKNEIESIDLLDRLLKNKKLPEAVKRDISSWRTYLTLKKYGVFEEPQFTSATAIEDYITERNNLAARYRLGNQRLVIDLETNQHLYDLLEKSLDKNLRPWILYWLAYQEKDYRQNMFDMSVEYYLKECIEKYSSQPAAKRCLGLYKEIQIESFTGTRGTEIPGSVQATLNKYEKLVNGK
ncbi:MAG: hypothetical protein ACXWQQ_08985 [Pseudobdellovibrio sp.]